MTYWTLGQAAKETGKSKSLIHKALKDGRLSYIEKTQNGYKIDPAEAFRVFPIERSEHPKKNETEQTCTPENTIENRLYEQKIASLERELSIIEKQLEKSEAREKESLERERKQQEKETHLLKIIENQTLQLEHVNKKRRFLWWEW
jgi:hypothetical protein